MRIRHRVGSLWVGLVVVGFALGSAACGSSKAKTPVPGTAGSAGPGAGGSLGPDGGAGSGGGNSVAGAGGNATAGAGGSAPTGTGGSVTGSAGGPGVSIGPPTTEHVIDTAVAMGTLSAELGILYKVYALFGDPRLPAQYLGTTPEPEQIDSPIMAIAAEAYPTLSAATQALLIPFFIPPIYAQSWYASRLPTPTRAFDDPLAFDDDDDGERLASGVDLFSRVFCALVETSGIAFRERTTAHVRVHEPIGNYAYGGETETADIIVANAETVYAAVTGAFGRVPPSDLDVSTTCNGGDGRLDVYVVGGSLTPNSRAVTIAYNGCGSPSYILITKGGSEKDIRDTLAHEFFHTLELGAYQLSAACTDYQWLGEATANLSIDLAFPADQYEHDHYARFFAYGERMTPIDEPSTLYTSNGYADYVFLEYLARKYGNDTVKAVWDATESMDSLHALVSAVEAKGGTKKIWGEFALASWNDTAANVPGAFYDFDSFEWGIKKAFDEGDAGRDGGQKSVKVALGGAPRKTFLLMQTALGGGKQLPRLSIQADYLKFTDDAVRSVMFTNPLALGNIPELKIQAIVKQGGQWMAPEDWTKVGSKRFCRDKKDERIEELVVIFSNADGRRPAEPIPFAVSPRLAASNVGCWRWEGTSSSNSSGGPIANDNQCSATAAFKLDRTVVLEGFAAAQESFTVDSGQVTGKGVVDFGTCTIETSASGALKSTDGRLTIHLDLDLGFEAPDRDVVMGTGSSTLPTLSEFICPEMRMSSTGDSSWSWLATASDGVVSADGTTIEGSVTETLPSGGGTTTRTWHLTSMREP